MGGLATFFPFFFEWTGNTYILANFIATNRRLVTLNGGLVREVSRKKSLNSGLEIMVIYPELHKLFVRYIAGSDTLLTGKI